MLDSSCDCDLLPDDCFEGTPIQGVCLAETVGGGASDGGNGADSSGGGGIDPNRLKSAITVLHGQWTDVTNGSFVCSDLVPVFDNLSPEGTPFPNSAFVFAALDNGTSFDGGLLQTCPAPATDQVSISTFDTTLGELCDAIPLCKFTFPLSLNLYAKENGNTVASGTITNNGSSIQSTESGAPLTVGDHDVDLCIEDGATQFELCDTQPMRAAAPLGSGVDTYGHFAGEMAADFVPIAGKPGAIALGSTDDGVTRLALPSAFRFPFYGATVQNYIWVGSNGGINTTYAAIGPGNTGLPASPSANAPDIAVYWDDLDPSSGGGVFAWYDGTRLIVSWENVPHGRDSGSSTAEGVSVQAHIYPTGYIEFHYLETDVGDPLYDDGRSATIGIGNVAGTDAVEVSHDSNTMLLSGVQAVGVAHSSAGCLADKIQLDPHVACTADDEYLTVCTPTGETVQLALPDTSVCEAGSAAVQGEVIESGATESTLTSLKTPIQIDVGGYVTLDEGVHRVRWWPVDAGGQQVGPSFTQLVFVKTWVHSACGGSGRSMLILTSEDDTQISDPVDPPQAVIGLEGDDLVSAPAGSDFLGDGVGAGVCEANDGDDLLVGEDGDDTLDGGVGDDKLWGGLGSDLLVGGQGNDRLDGQEGADVLMGDNGDDELWGGVDDDVLEGGNGDDTLFPGDGANTTFGGAGDDTIVILASCELTAGALISGGAGTDTLLLPPGMTQQTVEAAGVVLEGIESVQESSALPTHRAACGEE